MKKITFLILLSILTLSCIPDRYEVVQEVITDSSDTIIIKTHLYKYNEGAALKGSPIYKSDIGTNNIDSVDVYMRLEIEKANNFKEIFKRLQK